jgi:hypothetical protein
MRERQLFSYVVDHDYGINPNPVGGLCTLAHCKFKKPWSRRRNVVELAEVSDWVVGTGGQKLHLSAGNGRLIYAMRVTDKIPLTRYLNDRKYVGRIDRYEDEYGTHGRFVLISDDFFYFGRNAIDVSRIPARHLTDAFEKRGQNHRHDFTEAFIADFEQWLRSEFRPGINGAPCAGRPPGWGSRTKPRCRPVRCV